MAGAGRAVDRRRLPRSACGSSARDAPTQAGRIGIFSDGRGNIFSGKDGDIIEGRYKVLKVSPDAVELSYLDGRGRQTIRLTGQ